MLHQVSLVHNAGNLQQQKKGLNKACAPYSTPKKNICYCITTYCIVFPFGYFSV